MDIFSATNSSVVIFERPFEVETVVPVNKETKEDEGVATYSELEDLITSLVVLDVVVGVTYKSTFEQVG